MPYTMPSVQHNPELSTGIVCCIRTVRLWYRMLRDVVQRLLLEIFKMQLHKSLSNLV